MTHLVDSDRVIDFLNDKHEARALLAPFIRDRRLSTSVIVLAEVYEGLLVDPAREKKSQTLADVLSSMEVLGITKLIARSFASMRSSLRSAGQIINDHDIWIAATALEHDLTLISRDRHFDRIPDLKLLR